MHDLQGSPDVSAHVEISHVFCVSNIQHHFSQRLPQLQTELDLPRIGHNIEAHRSDVLRTDSKGRKQFVQANFFEGFLEFFIEVGLILLLPNFRGRCNSQCFDSEKFPKSLTNANCAETSFPNF